MQLRIKNKTALAALQFSKYTGEIRQYILLLLLPLILGAALLFCIQAITSEQIERRGAETARHLSSTASSVLRELQLVSDSILKDGQLVKELAAPSTSDPAALCATIKSHLNESPYVSGAYVICERQQRIYTERGYFMYEGLNALLLNIISNGSDSTLADDADDAALNLSPGWHVLNVNYAPPYYVVSIDSGGREAATLLLTLNMREFLRSFYSTDADLCCIFNEELSFSTLLRNYSSLDWYSPEEVSRVLGTDVRCFYISEGDFVYLTAISVREYRAPLRMVIYVFGAYFALVLLVGWLYLLRVSKRRYRTVAEMVNGLPHGLGADPTYEEILSTVRSTLNTYRDRYQEERERAVSMQLQHILTGSYLKQLSAQQLSAAEILLDCAGYYVCLLHIKGQNELVSSGPHALNIDATCMIFKSAFVRFSNGILDVTAAPIDGKYYAVFSLHESTDREFIRGVLQSTCDLLAQEYGLWLLTAVSSLVTDPEQLHQAYTDVNSFYRFSTAVGSFTPVIMQDDMETQMSTILSGGYLKQVEILSRTLNMEKYDVVPSMVEVILEEHVSSLGQHYNLAADRLSALANLLAEAVMASCASGDEAKALARSLRTADNVAALNERTRTVFADLLRHPRRLENDSLVSKACLYIQQNLSNAGLSVPEIGQAMEISVQHLSRLFKQTLNTTILEYINACRIELAKKTLAETDLTVAQVAEIAGYNNTVTLSRNFKRYVGLPPSEYRELNK